MEGCCFLLMERLDGGTLEDKIAGPRLDDEEEEEEEQKSHTFRSWNHTTCSKGGEWRQEAE